MIQYRLRDSREVVETAWPAGRRAVSVEEHDTPGRFRVKVDPFGFDVVLSAEVFEAVAEMIRDIQAERARLSGGPGGPP